MFLHQLSFPQQELVKNHKRFYDAYSLHQFIWSLASENKSQKRNFLYRVEYDEFQKIKHIYVLASTCIKAQDNIQIKTSSKFQPQLHKGDPLFFKLRANPIIKRKIDGQAKEYSVVMDMKHQFEKSGKNYLDQYSLSGLIHEAGSKWLMRKGADNHGFRIEPSELRIDNFREFSVSSPGKNKYKLRTLDFEGILTIIDPVSFVNALFSGVGSAKSFGCGLMLVKRI